jgi:RNA polymerase-binding transcription factor
MDLSPHADRKLFARAFCWHTKCTQKERLIPIRGVSEVKNYMTKADPQKEKKQRQDFLRQASEMLEEMKRSVAKDMQGRVNEETEGVKDEVRDSYDLATDDRDRELKLILNDRGREKLLAIDESLQRIGDKTYGICESCEGEIQLGRLKILPFTRLCIKCQEENEKENKRQKIQEDGRSNRIDIEDDSL